MLDFYNLYWYDFAIGHYMTWLFIGGLSVVTLDVYLKTNKTRNDIRRFSIEHRK